MQRIILLITLKQRNCDITIFPYNATYEEIMNIKPDGVLLSNGPGDPKTVEYQLKQLKNYK